MKRTALLLAIGSSIILGEQGGPTGNATTTGFCSPANTGSNNRFVINCGIGTAQGQKMIEVLNRIISHQLDPDLVLSKLDALTQQTASAGVLLSKVGSSIPMVQVGDSGTSLAFLNNSQALGALLKVSELIIEQVNGRLAVSIRIRGADGKMIAEINRNEWTVRPEHTWDRNFNGNALEVKDASGDIVLQVVLLPDRIKLQAAWYDDYGKFWELVSSPDPQRPGALVLVNRPDSSYAIPITPIFRYPSALHPGELLPSK